MSIEVNEREQKQAEQERPVTERFLAWYNRKHETAFDIVGKPDKEDRKNPAPDWLCHDEAPASSMMIEVGFLPHVRQPGQQPIESNWCPVLARLEHALDERTVAEGLGWTPMVLLFGRSVEPPPRAPEAAEGLASAIAGEIMDVAKILEQSGKACEMHPLLMGQWKALVARLPRSCGATVRICQASPAQGKQKGSYDSVPEMLVEAHQKLGWRPQLKAKRVLLCDCHDWRGWDALMQLRGRTPGPNTPACRLQPALREMESWRRSINNEPESRRAAYEEGLRNMGLKFTPAPRNWNIDEIYCLGPDWMERLWRADDRAWQFKIGQLEGEEDASEG